MHLDRLARVGLCRVVFPNHFLVAVDLLNLRPSLLKEHVAVGQHVRIVDGTDRDLPLEGTVRREDSQTVGRIISSEDPAARNRQVSSVDRKGGGDGKDSGQHGQTRARARSGVHGRGID